MYSQTNIIPPEGTVATPMLPNVALDGREKKVSLIDGMSY
jgi:hypothetical protein